MIVVFLNCDKRLHILNILVICYNCGDRLTQTAPGITALNLHRPPVELAGFLARFSVRLAGEAFWLAKIKKFLLIISKPCAKKAGLGCSFRQKKLLRNLNCNSKQKVLKTACFQHFLAPWRGLEPPIYRLGGGCVIHYATRAYYAILSCDPSDKNHRALAPLTH